jgi:alpha-tubulin suppressor-like RCC1 family protein
MRALVAGVLGSWVVLSAVAACTSNSDPEDSAPIAAHGGTAGAESDSPLAETQGGSPTTPAIEGAGAAGDAQENDDDHTSAGGVSSAGAGGAFDTGGAGAESGHDHDLPPCEADSWDDDGDPHTACVKHRDCPWGAKTDGNAHADAVCRVPAHLALTEVYSCAGFDDGSVRCWGDNYYGQLGGGAPAKSSTPITISALSNVTQLAAGNKHLCALLGDGSVECQGRNDHGQLGNGSFDDSPTPLLVRDLSGITSLAAGWDHTCAASHGSKAKCWGNNDFGQLGRASLADDPVPKPVDTLSDPTAVASSYLHSCVLMSATTVQCFGLNDLGQVTGTVSPSPFAESSPLPVPNLAQITQISVGKEHNCARLSDGSVECWGHGEAGQLGHELAHPISAPPEAIDGLSGVASVAAGGSFSCARTSAGEVKCWGTNTPGLGNGAGSSSIPAAVTGLSEVKALAAAFEHACAISGQDIYCWGSNVYGQLGDGTTDNSSVPVRVIASP